ncbi:uncharacterized protein TRUGW13939_02213 [Talaromyces rugulosus]|uniref:Uncharacterized protein n=1 Tax=Talaromyces rugulosus TaxID=121627 RepID=A0A7H8QNT4_TALRU|nr:uncharacterized protein TRUGW13939_02213 [Talaromyces rugulosus]QKX55121.1 hypothetical protein TRUGW13939_02213 [Talaromyces rugulosus]
MEEQPLATYAGPRFQRKYGRGYRFLGEDLTNLGFREFGKVTVDCRFRQSEARWGVLGDRASPAGIIYMDLTFNQPNGCQLENATVSITLHEEEALELGDRKTRFNRRAIPSNALNITDSYGPKHISGEPTLVPVKRTFHGTPQFTVLGAGGGGLGVDQEKTFNHTSRWMFTGQLVPGKEGRGTGTTYRTLKWELTENELERQSVHSNPIHTAFAFQHERKPFYMQVEIQGKLRKSFRNIKEKTNEVFRSLKFPPDAKQDQGSSLTLVNVNQPDSSQRRLDTWAQGLPIEMARRNYLEMAIELPSVFKAKMDEAPVPTSTEIAQNNLPETKTSAIPDAPPAAPSAGNLATTDGGAAQNIINLSRAVERFTFPQETLLSNCDIPAVAPPIKLTGIAESQAQQPTAIPRGNPVDVQVDLVRLAQYPILVAFVQMLASFLDLFPLKSSRRLQQAASPLLS